MTADGERAPRIGEQFRNSVISLLKELGYQEDFSGHYGIDFAAKPPDDHAPFRRPPFSPTGRTGFEFTAEASPNIQNEAELLTTKIEEYNSLQSQEDAIEGGLLIVDAKVRNSLIERVAEENIYCWDSHYLSFLTAKCRLWTDWTPEERRMRSRRAFREEVLDQMVSSFKVIKPRRGFNDVQVGIFHHSPFQIMSVSDANAILAQVLNPIKINANREALDTVLHVQMHVSGEIERGLLYDFVDVLTNHVDDFVKLQENSCRIHQYYCAPWQSFLNRPL